MQVFKIVLTGGPRGGKSSVIEEIKNKFSKEENTHVIIIPETATLLDKNGIPPVGDKKKVLAFQDIVYTLQRAKETAVSNVIKAYNNDSIIFVIHDRGIMDNRAYLEDEEFEDILKRYNDSELKIIDNYDLVLGLCSSSKIEGEYETLSNPSRFETANEAILRDKRTLDCWKLHRNYKIIDATEIFEEKIELVLKEIENLANHNSEKKIQRYLFNTPFNLNALLKEDTAKFKQTNYYIHSEIKEEIHTLSEKRYNGYSSYNLNIKKIIDDKEITIKDEIITEEEARKILIHNVINRMENVIIYTFIRNCQVWRLILNDGKYFLEVETTPQHPTVELPDELSDAIFITNDYFYKLNNDLGLKRSLKKW